MKLIYYILTVIFLIVGCATNQFEKEKLDFEKDKLKFEKEKLDFDKKRLEYLKKNCDKCCNSSCNNCNTPCNSCPTEASVEVQEPELAIVKEEKTGCERVLPPTPEELWKLGESGGWSYHPDKIKSDSICKGDDKEAFYKTYHSLESFVAETQLPKTRQNSCINNVLFYGKGKLYKLMEDKTISERLSSTQASKIDKEVVLKEIVEYNTSGKKRSFYYECLPTDPERTWGKCKCLLYASYPKGEFGLEARLKR